MKRSSLCQLWSNVLCRTVCSQAPLAPLPQTATVSLLAEYQRTEASWGLQFGGFLLEISFFLPEAVHSHTWDFPKEFLFSVNGPQASRLNPSTLKMQIGALNFCSCHLSQGSNHSVFTISAQILSERLHGGREHFKIVFSVITRAWLRSGQTPMPRDRPRIHCLQVAEINFYFVPYILLPNSQSFGNWVWVSLIKHCSYSNGKKTKLTVALNSQIASHVPGISETLMLLAVCLSGVQCQFHPPLASLMCTMTKQVHSTLPFW